MMKKKRYSLLLAVVIAAVAIGGCKKQNELKVRKSIEEWSQNDIIQINNVRKSVLEDGTEKSFVWTIIVNKKDKMICDKTVSEGPNGEKAEATIYYGVEDGKAYQISKSSGDKTYKKRFFENDGVVKSYMNLEPMTITRKSMIEILGEEKSGNKNYTKVKVTTPDFQRIQDKAKMKEAYENAKESPIYQEQFQKAEKEYENHKEEMFIWFDEDWKLQKAEKDTSVNDKFVDVITKAYFDVNGENAKETAMVKTSTYCQEFLTGKKCDKIVMPAEFEVLEEDK